MPDLEEDAIEDRSIGGGKGKKRSKKTKRRKSKMKVLRQTPDQSFARISIAGGKRTKKRKMKAHVCVCKTCGQKMRK
jgi:hypothetical protein